MSRNPERNDRKGGKKEAFPRRPEASGDGPKKGGWNPNPPAKTFKEGAPRVARGKVDADNFVWGRHPVLAALANPARKGMGRLLATPDRAQELERDGLANGHVIESIDPQLLERMLPPARCIRGWRSRSSHWKASPWTRLPIRPRASSSCWIS